MIKGFIEVTDQSQRKVQVNISHIAKVCGDTIIMDYYDFNFKKGYMVCQEDYETICKLMEEAQ